MVGFGNLSLSGDAAEVSGLVRNLLGKAGRTNRTSPPQNAVEGLFYFLATSL